jgi:hypothetical protein
LLKTFGSYRKPRLKCRGNFPLNTASKIGPCYGSAHDANDPNLSRAEPLSFNRLVEVAEACFASGQNESAPKTGALPKFNRSGLQAATLVGVTSRTLLEFAIGIDRGFIASGISRTRSTCSSPFSRLAPLTFT